MQFLWVAFVLGLVLQTPAPAPAPALAPQEKAPAPPKPYDEQADAKQDLAAALARASAENRRVLIQWGGNWCGWCVLLHQLYRSDREIAKKLLYEYDVVYVDVGHFDKNQDLAQKYGANLKEGVPYLTVLDGAGRVLANQETGALEKEKAHDPAKVLAFLTQHQAPPWKAEELLAAAQKTAAESDRRVLVTFGAPWCPWCHKLEDWMALPEPTELLAKDFVIRKIDVDRTVGGAELHKRLRPEGGGIPWFAVLDAEGRVLASSVDEKNENIGCPNTDAEIATFSAMMQRVARKLTAEDVARLSRSLVERRERDQRAAAQRKTEKPPEKKGT